MIRPRTLLLTLLPVTLCIAPTPLAGSQTPQDEKPPTERDPFQPPGVLPGRSNSSSLPNLILRGYVEDESGVSLALIEAAPDATYIVRTGDSFVVLSGSASISISVTEMSSQGVVLEVGPSRTRLELR